MKKYFTSIPMYFAILAACYSQQLKTHTPIIDQAFALAVKTLDDNTQNKLIKAGGEYGGEWTRDCAINSWNAASLIRPAVAEFSLWSVTVKDRTLIGHQYWDKIIWVTAAYNHYLVNGDRAFLKQAYQCAANTMRELEKEQWDEEYGLFKGPSVFNDGIAGYDEPIYQSSIQSTFVLDYPAAKSIKCLSTNAVYYQAYVSLAKMADINDDLGEVAEYNEKAATLKKNIREHLFDQNKNRLNYLIDQNGTVHRQQEGLGISFAILFDIVSKEEAQRIIDSIYVSPHGLPSIYPHFKRFSDEKPGRHNAMIWPFVNAFWSEACLRSGREDYFRNELINLADLAINKGSGDFYEIYNELTGEPDGGWQTGQHRHSCSNQTWSATGYLRMIFTGLFGMKFDTEGMELDPDFRDLQAFGFTQLTALPYQRGTIDIKFSGTGQKLSMILMDGKKVDKALVVGNHTGNTTIEYIFSQ